MRHPHRVLRLALCVAVAGSALWAPTTAGAAALGPACPTRDLAGNPLPNSGLYQCAAFRNPGPHGSIYVVGDSVLLGSADGYAAPRPGLGSMLAKAGWGPVVLQATVGMRSWWDTAAHPAEKFKRGSAAWMIDHWQAQGFAPHTIAVNVASNEIATCSRASTTACRAQIERVLAAAGPGVQVWWAKGNFVKVGSKSPLWPSYQGSLGWNLALDQEAKLHSNLVVWDWPTALATAKPAIVTDGYGIHAASKNEYVKRSTLMAAHISTFIPAVNAGTSVALPSALSTGLRFSPERRLAAGVDRLTDPITLGANSTATIDLATSTQIPLGTDAIALTAQVTGGAASGSLSVAPCASVANSPTIAVEATATRAIHLIVPLEAGHTFCARSTVSTVVQFALEGSLVGGAGAPTDALALTAAAAAATVAAAPGTDDASPNPVPAAGDGASVQVTTTSLTGTVKVYVGACGEERPLLPSLVARKGETGIGLTYTATGSGSICVWRSSSVAGLPVVNVNVTGTFASTGFTFSLTNATRLLHTGVKAGAGGLGGWYGRQVAGQAITVRAAGTASAIATGVVSLSAVAVGGIEKAGSSASAARPVLAARPMVSSSGAVSVPTNAVGTLLLTSSANGFLAFDLSGWWS